MLIPFEFDGIKSSVYGLYLCSFDGSRDGVSTLGNEVEIKTVKSPKGNRFIRTGSTYETPLTFSFQVMKYDCKYGISEISSRELARLLRWLVRKEYHYLRFEQSEWDNVYYNCTLRVQKYEIAGKILGLEIDVSCDAPWGYSEQKEYHLDFNLKNEYNIYNYSDEDGGILPDLVTIQCSKNGDLILKNTFLVRNDENNKKITTIEIKNCKKGEIIQLDRHKNISSSAIHDNLMNDFNYVFLELFSDLYNSENIIYSESKCNLSIYYREIRKGVLV